VFGKKGKRKVVGEGAEMRCEKDSIDELAPVGESTRKELSIVHRRHSHLDMAAWVVER